jgi:hypothetical protein
MNAASWMLWRSLAAFFVAGLTCDVASAQDKVEEVMSLGQAVIYSGDKAAARDKAIDDALRKAVEQAVGTMVSSETVTENFQLISDKIFSQSKGYVTSYKILSEGQEAGIFQVKLKAKVGVGNLKNALDGILQILRAKNLPRVLVMVAEQHVGQESPAFWWGEKTFKTTMDVVENAIIAAWQPKGVRFVDRQALQGKLSAGLASNAAPDQAMVKEFAGNTGAEVVIRGDAVAQDNGPIMGTQMHSIQASVSVRAMNLDNGAVMGTATVTQSVGHINPLVGGNLALKKAGEKAAGELLDRILAQWQSEVSGSATVSVQINGVKRSKILKTLNSFIRNEVRGVTDVRQRSLRKKVARMEVDLKGTTQDLATELEEKKFPGFTIEIDEITANSITATLK